MNKIFTARLTQFDRTHKLDLLSVASLTFHVFGHVRQLYTSLIFVIKYSLSKSLAAYCFASHSRCLWWWILPHHARVLLPALHLHRPADERHPPRSHRDPPRRELRVRGWPPGPLHAGGDPRLPVRSTERHRVRLRATPASNQGQHLSRLPFDDEPLPRRLSHRAPEGGPEGGRRDRPCLPGGQRGEEAERGSGEEGVDRRGRGEQFYGDGPLGGDWSSVGSRLWRETLVARGRMRVGIALVMGLVLYYLLYRSVLCFFVLALCTRIERLVLCFLLYRIVLFLFCLNIAHTIASVW